MSTSEDVPSISLRLTIPDLLCVKVHQQKDDLHVVISLCFVFLLG